MEIIKTFSNDILKREEYLVEFAVEKNLTREEVKEKVSKQFKKEKDLIVLNNVKTHFGVSKILVDFFVYEDKKFLDNFTEDYLKKRQEKKVEEKKEEKKEEKAEEKKEEVVEEKKAEVVEEKKEEVIEEKKEEKKEEVKE